MCVCYRSRYWKKDTYHQRLSEGKEPEKLDKDCIRDYIKSQCDPYNDTITVLLQVTVISKLKMYIISIIIYLIIMN